MLYSDSTLSPYLISLTSMVAITTYTGTQQLISLAYSSSVHSGPLYPAVDLTSSLVCLRSLKFSMFKKTLAKQAHAFHSSHESLPPNIPCRERVEKLILLQSCLCQLTSTPFACADGSLDIAPPSSYPLTSVNHRFRPSDLLGGLLLPRLLELPHSWSFHICPRSSLVHQSFKDPKF